MPDISLTQALTAPAESASAGPARRNAATAGALDGAASTFSQALDARMSQPRQAAPPPAPAKSSATKAPSPPEKPVEQQAPGKTPAAERDAAPASGPEHGDEAKAATSTEAASNQDATAEEETVPQAGSADPALLLGLLGQSLHSQATPQETPPLETLANALAQSQIGIDGAGQPTGGSTDLRGSGERGPASERMEGLLAELTTQQDPAADTTLLPMTEALARTTAEHQPAGTPGESAPQMDLAGLASHGGAAAGHASAPARAAELQQVQVATPLNQPGWTEEVAQKLTFIAKGDDQKAELVLTPPNLGKVEISLTLNGDQASAQFIAPSPNVRDALEQALPRLREMLAGAGIQLGDANVSARDPGSRNPSGDTPRDGGGNGRNGIEALGSMTGLAPTALRGLVDTFA